MKKFDLSSLPAPLPLYFAMADHRKTSGLFAPDASVRDEGETHNGQAAIAGWLDRVERQYQPRYVVQDANTEADRIVITVQVSGTFPGSPAVLRQAFTLADEQIARLETL